MKVDSLALLYIYNRCSVMSIPLDLKKSFTKRLYGFGALNFCGGFFGGGGSAPERPERFLLPFSFPIQFYNGLKGV